VWENLEELVRRKKGCNSRGKEGGVFEGCLEKGETIIEEEREGQRGENDREELEWTF